MLPDEPHLGYEPLARDMVAGGWGTVGLSGSPKLDSKEYAQRYLAVHMFPSTRCGVIGRYKKREWRSSVCSVMV